MSKSFSLAAIAMLVSSTWPAPGANVMATFTDLPSDVMAFVGHRSACQEWSQRAFDPERKSQLNNIMSILRSLKCDEVANEERVFRQKYAGDPSVLRALDASWVKVVKRLPVRIPVPPDLKD